MLRFATCTLLLVLPHPLAGQTITAFAGGGLPLTIESRWTTIGVDDTSRGRISERTSHGFVVGLRATVPMRDRFQFRLEGARYVAGVAELRTPDANAALFKASGATVWMVKAGLGYLPSLPVPVVLSAGPAVFRVDPEEPRQRFPDFPPPNEILGRKPIDHWGFYLAAGITLPINRHAAFNVDVDDSVILWHDAERARQIEDVYEERSGQAVTPDLETETSQVITLRLGFSLTL